MRNRYALIIFKEKIERNISRITNFTFHHDVKNMHVKIYAPIKPYLSSHLMPLFNYTAPAVAAG